MKIDKAIERLSDSLEHNTILITRGDKDAIKLGIEALKLLENPTDPRLIYTRKLLLGEV